MSKIYFRANEFKKDILDNRDKVFERGYLCGFHTGNDFISYKKGFTSYYYAHPFQGKTSFVLDQLVYIATKYNSRIAVYSPEGGDKKVLISAIVQVFLGKKLHGRNKKIVTIDEWEEALNFIDKHFVIIDPKLTSKDSVKFTGREAFNTLYKAEKEYGWKIDVFLLDPFNYLMKDNEQMKMSIADFTLDSLMFINQASKESDIHTIICMHLRDDDLVVDKDTGIEYMPRPYPSKIMNGQNVWRAGQCMIGIWRTPSGVFSKKEGGIYPDNRTDIIIQKNKIFGSGEVGEFSISFDDSRQKFYEVIDGVKYYIGEYEAKFNSENPKQQLTLKPSTKFDGPF